MALWYGAEMEAHFEVQGGAADFAVGQKVRVTGKSRREDTALTAVITAYQWDHLLEWQFQESYGVRGSSVGNCRAWTDVGGDPRQIRDAGDDRKNFDRLFTRSGCGTADNLA